MSRRSRVIATFVVILIGVAFLAIACFACAETFFFDEPGMWLPSEISRDDDWFSSEWPFTLRGAHPRQRRRRAAVLLGETR
jgi:hypothetical protein